MYSFLYWISYCFNIYIRYCCCKVFNYYAYVISDGWTDVLLFSFLFLSVFVVRSIKYFTILSQSILDYFTSDVHLSLFIISAIALFFVKSCCFKWFVFWCKYKWCIAIFYYFDLHIIFFALLNVLLFQYVNFKILL